MPVFTYQRDPATHAGLIEVKGMCHIDNFTNIENIVSPHDSDLTMIGSIIKYRLRTIGDDERLDDLTSVLGASRVFMIRL